MFKTINNCTWITFYFLYPNYNTIFILFTINSVHYQEKFVDLKNVKLHILCTLKQLNFILHLKLLPTDFYLFLIIHNAYVTK